MLKRILVLTTAGLAVAAVLRSESVRDRLRELQPEGEQTSGNVGGTTGEAAATSPTATSAADRGIPTPAELAESLGVAPE